MNQAASEKGLLVNKNICAIFQHTKIKYSYLTVYSLIADIINVNY